MNDYVPWTFDESLNFARELQGMFKPFGFNVGLTGSILYKGESSNDLDIIVYPQNSGKVDIDPLRDVLLAFGMTLLADRAKVANIWARKGSTDAKHVEAWKTPKGQKVDLFFLR